MIYFNDKLYTIIPDNDKYIIYCGNLRKAIRLSYSKMYLYKTIVENQSLMPLEIMLSKFKIKRDDYNDLVEQMLEKKIFFTDFDDFQKEDFGHRYKVVTEERKLEKVYLHVTQRCNLNCYYCYNRKNLNTGRKEFGTDEWKSVIGKLYEEGIKEFVITGGEPTIRDDLEEILSFIPKDCKISILTNGTLLTDEKVKIFQYADEVIVSLDSMERDNNDSNRENSVKYNVLSNIDRLNESQRSKLIVRTVITKNNIGDIASLKKYVQENLGVRYITSGYLPNSSNECEEFIPLENEVQYKVKMNNLIACGAGLVEIAIDSNGDIYPCQSLIKPEFRLGNMSDVNWKKKIQEKSENILQPLNINEIEKCKDCVYKYFCGTGCRAVTYNIFKEINRCNDFFCEFYKQKAVSDIRKLFQ